MTEMTYEMAQNTLKRKPQTPSHPPDPRSVLQVGPGSYGGSIETMLLKKTYNVTTQAGAGWDEGVAQLRLFSKLCLVRFGAFDICMYIYIYKGTTT